MKTRARNFSTTDFTGLAFSHGKGSKRRFHASRINPKRRVLEYVPVPLYVRVLHRQKVELLAFRHEPDRD
jgi:hypothetical protein